MLLVGCSYAYSAERLFAAGIIYWFISEMGAFDTENILSIDTGY